MIKFYWKLAKDNIKKNKSIYMPYIASNIIMVTVFYLFLALQDTVTYYKELQKFPQLLTMITLGIFVLGLFLFLFEIYINSFVVRKRQQEYGVINVLGFTKKNIAKLNFCETIIIFIISLLIGLLIGVFLEKLILEILLNLTQIQYHINFKVSLYALIFTSIYFLGLLFVLWIINTISIKKKKSIDLIKADKKIEKKPKNNWIVGIIGLVILFSGYYISISVNEFDQAMLLIFVAVVLVIVGTYLLFISGSAMILNCLKKNKKFFYKRTNFISISNLIYRIRQNAVGLASICILSTMVVVTLSTTILIYNVPSKIQGLLFVDNTDVYINRFSVDKDYNIGNLKQEVKIALGNKYEIISTGNYMNCKGRKIIELNNYNQLEEVNIQLKSNEIAVSGDKYKVGDTIKLGNEKYLIKQKVYPNRFNNKMYEEMTGNKDNIIIVNKPLNKLNVDFMDISNDTYIKLKDHSIKNENAIVNKLDKILINNNSKGAYVDIVQGSKMVTKEQFSAVGSLLFVGFFLSAIFAITSVVIIYYKQISEGVRDKENIQMMQKIGMEDRLIKSTIKKQTLIIFFSPLIVCFIHVIMAYPIFAQILKIFLVSNKLDVIITSVIVFIGYALLYGIAYLLSSKSYYKIIKAKG